MEIDFMISDCYAQIVFDQVLKCLLGLGSVLKGGCSIIGDGGNEKKLAEFVYFNIYWDVPCI
jgi:hypothetical protein